MIFEWFHDVASAMYVPSVTSIGELGGTSRVRLASVLFGHARRLGNEPNANRMRGGVGLSLAYVMAFRMAGTKRPSGIVRLERSTVCFAGAIDDQILSRTRSEWP